MHHVRTYAVWLTHISYFEQAGSNESERYPLTEKMVIS